MQTSIALSAAIRPSPQAANRPSSWRIPSKSAVNHDGEHDAVDEGVEVAVLFTGLDAEDRAVFVDAVVVDRGSAGDVVHVQHLITNFEPNSFGPVPSRFKRAGDTVRVSVVVLGVVERVSNRPDRRVGLDTARLARVRVVVIVVAGVVIVVVIVIVVVRAASGSVGHRLQAEGAISVDVLAVETGEVFAFRAESPTIVGDRVTRADLRTDDMVVRFEVPVGVAEVRAAVAVRVVVVRTVALRSLGLLVVARALSIRIQNADFRDAVARLVRRARVTEEVESVVELRVTNAGESFKRAAAERVETIVVHRFNGPRIYLGGNVEVFVSDRHRNKRVAVRVRVGRRAARRVRIAVVARAGRADLVKADDHPKTADLVNAARALLIKELIAVARPDVVVAGSAAKVVVADVHDSRVFQNDAAVNAVVIAALRRNDRAGEFPPMMSGVITDHEASRGFPVRGELRRRHLVALFRVSERRRRGVRGHVRNDVRNELLSAILASNDLVAGLRDTQNACADASVETFVFINAAAELIVRER